MINIIQVRVALERGELMECLEGFVAENATGSKRPEPIVYENLPTSDSDGLGKASQVNSIGLRRKKNSVAYFEDSADRI